MRIDLNHGAQTAETGRSAEPNSAAVTGAPGGASGAALGEDQAQLSGAHVQVEALAAQAAQLPEVRQERVAALRQAVSSGAYQASPEQVAGAMFEHMLAPTAA